MWPVVCGWQMASDQVIKSELRLIVLGFQHDPDSALELKLEYYAVWYPFNSARYISAEVKAECSKAEYLLSVNKTFGQMLAVGRFWSSFLHDHVTEAAV